MESAYLNATVRTGFNALDEGRRIDQELLCDLQESLLIDVRGEDKRPGHIRDEMYSIWRAVDLLVQVELTGEYERSPIVTADNTPTLSKEETGIG